jgi:hypothetical protein
LGNPARACRIVYLGGELNARLMTWYRVVHEVFASPRGELIRMVNLLGHEGVSAWSSSLGSMYTGLGWVLICVIGLDGEYMVGGVVGLQCVALVGFAVGMGVGTLGV